MNVLLTLCCIMYSFPIEFARLYRPAVREREREKERKKELNALVVSRAGIEKPSSNACAIAIAIAKAIAD